MNRLWGSGLVCLVFLFLNACSAHIILKEGLSPELLSTVKANPKVSPQFEVTSQLPELFVYKNSNDFEFQFNVNDAFRKNFSEYMQTRFPEKVPSGPPVNVDIQKLEIQYGFQQSGLEQTLYVLKGSDPQGNASVSADLTLKVTLQASKATPVSQTFHSLGHANARVESTGVETIYAQAVDEAISKSLVLIDQFLANHKL